MEDVVRRIVARHLEAAGVIDLGRVEKLRKDLLVLLSNLPRVKTYEDAEVLRQGFVVYQRRFDEVFFDRFLNQLKNRQHPNEGRLNYYLRKPAWDLYIELSLPLRRPDEYWSEERCLSQFQQNKDAWGKRVKRKAAVLWKLLKEEIRPEYGDGTEKPLETYEITRQRMVIEGFQVELEGTPEEAGGEHSTNLMRKGLEMMKEALKDYRRRASATVPWMLQNQLPLVLNMDLTLDKGGRYERDHIVVSVSSLVGQGVKWGVHVLAHEMGHHMYKTLPKAAQQYWDAAIREDYARDLDLNKLLAEWPASVKWTHTFAGSLEDSNPVLSLQLDILSRGHRGAHAYEERADFEKTLADGYDKISVPKTPISGYGGKDPEEGFCEALGLLVAYGPRTVDQTVLGWLNDVIPGRVKLAGRTP